MKIKESNIILENEEDFEFVNLIARISKMGHGDMTVKIRNSKPYRIIKYEEDILLTRDALKDSKDYGG